jgi:hypothetical protein
LIQCIRFADVAVQIARHGFEDLGEAGDAHVVENLARPGLPRHKATPESTVPVDSPSPFGTGWIVFR